MAVHLRTEREALEKLWEQGLSGRSLLLHHSRLVDEFIVGCFAGAARNLPPETVALVALGGYGRRELFPYSDIDLMLLYRPDFRDGVRAIADAVLYPLWDSGMEVGHGVRTVEESLQQAGEDYFFLVSMLDARLIAGSAGLFGNLLLRFRDEYIEGRRDVFVEKMKEHRRRRRQRYGHHSYLLEPHIKEGKGGLRDVQAMVWTAKVVFGLSDIEDIFDAGLLSPEEQKEFTASWDMLIRLRNRLHYVSRRKNDQLYLEQQVEMAEAFGYTGNDAVLAVENFMRDVYRQLRVVAVTTDLFFDHVDEVLGLAGKGPLSAPDKEIEKGIEIRLGSIHLVLPQQQLEARPHVLMRLFLAAARAGLPLHHRTQKVVMANLALITDKIRMSPRMSKAFMALLVEAENIFPVLETMLETAMLQTYIPEFSRIVTLAQHDVYHIYTVDRHSLQTVVELRLVAAEQETVYRQIASPQILCLAALLHDIGKGAGRDHSEEGAGIALAVGRRLGLSSAECDLLSFLVRYHLFIPENALRRDLNDAAFIQRCAETIGDMERLAMLYLLSIADSRATGPSAWSDWKATLMQEMFLRVFPYLDFSAGQTTDLVEIVRHEEQGADWLRDQVDDLLAGEARPLIDLASLSSDYILSFAPEKVVDHVRLHRDNYRLLRQKSLVLAQDHGDLWEILVLSSDRPGLLAKICGVVTLNNLAVVKAQIFTWDDGTVVDVLDVRPVDGLRFAEKDWRVMNADLDAAITHRFDLGHRLLKKLASGNGRRYDRSGRISPRVIIDNDSSDVYSVIEIHSADLPGMLYRITQTLADFGMNIRRAYIATEVERLIDVFYVLDAKGRKIIDAGIQREVVHGLLYTLGLKEA
ncbi:[protein-PII] uridylyltransferase [Desulfoprunum benzoelyticum]|uniref:Bifunctional uridylyltransferase/uridylyl-removing enzyme n=1 Tax=Desulfoprunum benzoelyticum TaxID=1506996 RepID=A0A840V1G1_9BACT|nr:[protein-PII] uridylyltransferase [Desulfoprunum benzoelyticum]MBB5347021.1 [protein-PII] uridylyltransferase [Desulfoprunum benzoelyticum]MBM9529715.1 [protein-PII] uridylyltransferase [Desulfoprunum benzoelyticum]